MLKLTKFKVFILLLALLLTSFYLTFPYILKSSIRSNFNLEENGKLFRKWKTFPVPIIMKFRFFSIQNPKSAINGYKLRVKEIGPFAFKVWRKKTILSYSIKKDKILYYENKIYHFDEQNSNGSLNDVITIVNPSIASLGAVITKLIDEKFPKVFSPVVNSVLNAIIDANKETIFIRKWIRDLLFGYKVEVLETIDKMLEPLKIFGIQYQSLPNNMFGLLYNRNNTPEGPFEIYTGIGDDSQSLGQIVSWKGLKKLIWWKDLCNTIRGSDGTLFAPFVKKTDRLYIMPFEICRSIYFTFENESEVKDIPVWRFSIGKEVFYKSKQNAENECYCTYDFDQRSHKFCEINGIFDLSKCQLKAPVFISAPHFLYADRRLLKMIDGLKPIPSEHSSYLDIEPLTGLVLHGINRIMLSFKVERIPHIRYFEKMRSAFIPFVWIENAEINDQTAYELKRELFIPIKVIEISLICSSAISWIILIISICVTYSFFKWKKNLKNRSTNNSNSMTIFATTKQDSNKKLDDIALTPNEIMLQTVVNNQHLNKDESNNRYQMKSHFLQPSERSKEINFRPTENFSSLDILEPGNRANPTLSDSNIIFERAIIHNNTADCGLSSNTNDHSFESIRSIEENFDSNKVAKMFDDSSIDFITDERNDVLNENIYQKIKTRCLHETNI